MKRTLVLAAAIIAAVACGPKMTNEEKQAAYEADLDEIMKEYNAAEDKESAEEIAIQKIVDLSFDVIKKNPSDSVALYALRNSYYYAETDELEKAIGYLSDNFKEDEFVKSVSESLAAKSATKEGKKFVDFTVDHISGLDAEGNPISQKVSLSDFVGKGKYVLVDFWSPWCGPCKAEVPNLKNVYDKYHGDNFDMLSVSVWEESRNMNWQNSLETAAELGMNWNVLTNGHKEPADLYGIDGIPHIILFGPDGTIVKRDLRGQELVDAVAAAVAE